MAKYECCGLMYDNAKVLTSHMRKDHNVTGFDVALACCDSTFVDSQQLSDHMKKQHHIDMAVEI